MPGPHRPQGYIADCVVQGRRLWWLRGKELPASTGDADLIPGLGSTPGGEMATHSSIFAWVIPWTEEPGGLQSMGSQKSWT